MKRGIFNSIYFLVFIFVLFICLPAALMLLREKSSNFLLGRRHLEEQNAFYRLNETVMKAQANPQFLLDFSKYMPDILDEAGRHENKFFYPNAGVYDLVEGPPNARYTFKLSRSYARNVLNSPPNSLSFTKEELGAGSNWDKRLSHYWVPFPNSDNPRQLFLISLQDPVRDKLMGETQLKFWLGAVVAFLMFYGAIGCAIHAAIKRPLRRLEAALSDESSTKVLEPDEYGDFGDLVYAMNVYMDRMRNSLAAARNIDPVTGLMSGELALSAYLQTRQTAEPTHAIFFRANFAKEFVKARGRVFRDKILKITANAAARGLPDGAKLFSIQDHFLMSFLTDQQFQQCFSQIHRLFNADIQALYDKKNGNKDIKSMTLSAVGISNKSSGYEAFHDTLQKLHDDWDSTVNKDKGGWALLNADDQWERGLPQEVDGSGEPDIVPEEPESLKDPVFARKVFIVKLVLNFNFEPQKAAKLYQIGFTRIPALLAEDAAETAKKHGLEADVRRLADKIKLVPKSRLYYNETDFKQVFITDVRMIQKIPRETAGRWFSAGFRRVEDLADISVEDLVKIDGAVSKEDVQAILEKAKSVAQAAAGAGKAVS